MKKLHTNLFLSLCLFLISTLGFTAQSQDCFFTTASSLNASNGSVACVDVSVHGFVDIASFQFSLIFDPLILKYNSVSNENLPGPGGGQFGTALIDSGVLTFFWFDDMQGWDVPDRTRVFSVCFDVTGAAGQISDVDFSSVATNIEVYDSNLDEVDFHSMAGTVAVDGNPVNLIQLDTCESNPNCTTNLNLVVEGGVDPLTYNWVGPNGFTSSSEDLAGIASGLYAVTVSDNNGASATASYSLGELIPAISDFAINDVKCFGFNNGTINITMEGGVLPYTYSWSNGSVFEDISSLAPGDFTVTVTDAAGCEVVATYTVNGNDPIEAVSIDVDCETDAGNDGFVTIEVMGGSGNYSFDWSFGPSTTTGVYGGLAAGEYDVSVTDEFNCPYVIIPFGISAGIISTEDASICSGGSTMLNVDAPKGETYTWTPADFLSCTDCPSPVASPNMNIQYHVTVVDSSGCTDQDSLMVTVFDGCVWPGETDLDKEVSHYDLLNIGLGAGETGPQRTGASTAWVGQPADSWGQSTPISNVNYKYADADGSGTINAQDTMAIAANWGEMHNLTGSGGSGGQKHAFAARPNWSVSSGGPVFTIDAPDTLMANQTVSLPITLGNSSAIISGIYGLAFSIDYDPTVVEAGSVSVALMNSWLGNPGANLIMMQRENAAAGRIDVAITAMDGNNRSGFGQMAVLNMTLKPINGATLTTLSISGAKLIDNVEAPVAVSLVSETVTIIDMLDGIDDLLSTAQLSVFPNPTKEVLHLNAGTAQIESVQLYDITGRLLPQPRMTKNKKTLYFSKEMEGHFFLRIQTTEGLAMRRVVVF